MPSFRSAASQATQATQATQAAHAVRALTAHGQPRHGHAGDGKVHSKGPERNYTQALKGTGNRLIQAEESAEHAITGTDITAGSVVHQISHGAPVILSRGKDTGLLPIQGNFCSLIQAEGVTQSDENLLA
jgi:hypothetical protein